MSLADKPVLIMAGGTGGHIFPGLAVARVLHDRQVPVIWLGSNDSMEEKLVSARGIDFIGLSVSGLRGKGLVKKITAPLKLIWAVFQACRIVLVVRPRAVIGLGGFASAPGGIAAVMLRRPLYIQEQNSIPGLTNRWLSKFSYCNMEGFAGSFESLGVRAIHTGNPVRTQIEQLHPTGEKLTYSNRRLRLLIIGGSLGALRLNQLVPEAVADLQMELRPEIRHQTGAPHLDATKANYEALRVAVEATSFIDNMADAYDWADLIIARAGALTITEIMHAGLASILVPYPYAVDDHQSKNAEVLVNHGAAIVIADKELTGELLAQHLEQLLSNKKQIIKMGAKAKSLAQASSANKVVEISLSGARCKEISDAAG